MSQENVDVLRRLLDAFNDGDVDAIVAGCRRAAAVLGEAAGLRE